MATAIGTYATRALVTARVGGTFDSGENSLIDELCNDVNAEIETTTGRVLAPISSATYLFDGNDRRELWIPMGVRAVTLLEIAPFTGGTFETIPAGDYYLRPLPQNRRPTWPATRVRLSDLPTGSYATFIRGMENVRITMTAGWAATPDDVIRVAVDAAVRAWHARQVGQPEQSESIGSPISTNYLSRRDRAILLDYSRESPVAA